MISAVNGGRHAGGDDGRDGVARVVHPIDEVEAECREHDKYQHQQARGMFDHHTFDHFRQIFTLIDCLFDLLAIRLRCTT